jgi:hypothetical protein
MATPRTIITLLLMSILLINPSTASQTLLHKSHSENITLNFDDLPTRHGFGNITSYHHLDFSSFTLINTSTAASAGNISHADTSCSTSSHNALIAHKSKTPSLWPRIALDPLAHYLPGQAPFFSLHGMSMKAMNASNLIVCILIQAYGVDEQKSVRTIDGLSVCSRSAPGGYVDITGVFPGWGRAVNMVEISAEALMGTGEEQKWVDWPFCVDDLTVEMHVGDWEWPAPWWGIIPLLPPLAPFTFDDQGGKDVRKGRKRTLFGEEAAENIETWIANGARGTLVDRVYMPRTL